MKKNNLILYGGLLALGLIAPFIFPAFKVQLSILCVLIVLAITWNIQGGEMGYNSFGNILFYGLGMYLCASVQVGMFFPLAEWTESGGEKTFVHTPVQFFQGIAVGLAVAAVIPAIVAGLIGYSILGLRGHYFAIGTLGLGVAAGEISGGIEIIGAGQGFTTPPFPNVGSLEARGEFFYYCSFVALVLTFIAVKSIYSTRFKLVLNAIRDNEDKAEAMGIQTMKYKIIGWMISAVIGATIFHIFKEGFWTFFLGWQYVALGVLIVVIVIYFPEGIMGWLREKYPEKFGEVVDEADRKAQVELK